MKPLKIIIPILAVMLLCSCQNESKNTFITLPLATKSFTAGTWHITQFYRHHKNEKDKYSSCLFHFYNNHKITVIQGRHSYTGNWSVTSDKGSDDIPPSDLTLTLAFTKGNGLPELNREWDISNRSISQLVLGEKENKQDYLVFEKQLYTEE